MPILLAAALLACGTVLVYNASDASLFHLVAVVNMKRPHPAILARIDPD
jgi:hypothetical protein